jgi:hypothetical protein
MPLFIRNVNNKKLHPKSRVKLYKILVSAMASISILFSSIYTFAAGKNGPAPDFTLASKNGGNVRLQEEYADLGFTILAVNVDEDPSKANILLDDISVSFPVLFDVNDDVSKLYDVQAMPTTVIVDRDGNQRLLHKGYKRGDEVKYQQAVKALLRE